MDYVTVVTAAGQVHFVSGDNRRNQTVRREKIVTRTGMQWPHARHKRQQLYLTLAGPLPK